MSQGTFFKYRAMLTNKKKKAMKFFPIFLTEQLEKKNTVEINFVFFWLCFTAAVCNLKL